MRYSVHGWYQRFEGDDGLQYVMWCSERTMRMPRSCSPDPTRSPISPASIAPATAEAIDKEIEEYQCQLGTLHKEETDEFEEEEAIREAREEHLENSLPYYKRRHIVWQTIWHVFR